MRRWRRVVAQETPLEWRYRLRVDDDAAVSNRKALRRHTSYCGAVFMSSKTENALTKLTCRTGTGTTLSTRRIALRGDKKTRQP